MSAKTIALMLLVCFFLVSASPFGPLSMIRVTGDTPLGVMRPTPAQLQTWLGRYKTAARATAATGPPTYPTSLSLLNYLQYTPSERNQGSCGDCWAWAGTGVLEIALAVQGVAKDRLSVQYLNSLYNGGSGSSWACCGGWLTDFVGFYSSQGLAVPWSNTNAAYADGGQTCAGQASMPGSSISTIPNYGVTSVSDLVIQTQGVGQAAAINNMKNVLNQNKAIWMAFFVANSQDGNAFVNFFFNQPESAVWNPDQYSGHTADNTGWGHAVLVVGYNDTDPSNRYWVVLNSWGAPSQRPDSLFRVKMDINYDDYIVNSPNYDMLFFDTLNVQFSSGSNPVTTTTTTNNTTTTGTLFTTRSATSTLTETANTTIISVLTQYSTSTAYSPTITSRTTNTTTYTQADSSTTTTVIITTTTTLSVASIGWLGLIPPLIFSVMKRLLRVRESPRRGSEREAD